MVLAVLLALVNAAFDAFVWRRQSNANRAFGNASR
jgi:hypothetical protein